MRLSIFGWIVVQRSEVVIVHLANQRQHRVNFIQFSFSSSLLRCRSRKFWFACWLHRRNSRSTAFHKHAAENTSVFLLSGIPRTAFQSQIPLRVERIEVRIFLNELHLVGKIQRASYKLVLSALQVVDRSALALDKSGLNWYLRWGTPTGMVGVQGFLLKCKLVRVQVIQVANAWNLAAWSVKVQWHLCLIRWFLGPAERGRVWKRSVLRKCWFFNRRTAQLFRASLSFVSNSL